MSILLDFWDLCFCLWVVCTLYPRKMNTKRRIEKNRDHIRSVEREREREREREMLWTDTADVQNVKISRVCPK